jgi:hypothetical protein
MYESKAFPTREMLGLNPNRLGLKLTDAEIIAHPEFAVRLDLITEQMRANGCYFGIGTLAFGDFLCALYNETVIRERFSSSRSGSLSVFWER